MRKSLDIVKTNVKPTFLDLSLVVGNAESYRREAEDFILFAKKTFPGLAWPFYAITEAIDCLQENPMVIGHEPLSGTALDLCDRISDLLERGKITAVVDFTNSAPQVLGAYELLAEKYQLTFHKALKVDRIEDVHIFD